MNRVIALVIVAVLMLFSFMVGRSTSQNEFFDGVGISRDGDSAGPVRMALATGGTLARMLRLSPALEAVSKDEIEEIVAVYLRELSTVDECDIAPFVDVWATIDPEAALQGVRDWPYAIKREIGIRHVLLAVSTNDPAKGRKLYEELVERHPRIRADLQRSFVTGWAITDPSGLRDYLLELSDDAMGPPLGAVLGTLAQFHGVDALIEWAEILIDQIPPGLLRAKVFRKAARTVARREPVMAADWVVAQQYQAHADDGVMAVAEAWILFAPTDALEWLEKGAPASGQARGLELAFGRWLYEDHPAASEWIETTFRTRFHDPAVATYARDFVRRSPNEAVDWCRRVIEIEARDECFRNVARGWFKNDRASAEAWLSSSPLSEEDRNFVREHSPVPSPRQPAGMRARRAGRRP